jgi:hypothetical protein
MVPDIAASAIVNAIKRSKASPCLLGQTPQAYDETRGTNRGALGFLVATIFVGTQRGIGQKQVVDMKRHTLIAALVFSALAVLATSPAVAQRATSNGQSQSTTQGTLQGVPSAPTPVPSQGPTTGVLHRGNDGDILQCRHRTQHERLWNEERRIEQRIDQRDRIKRRRRGDVIDPTLPDRTAIQRLVQLTKNKTAAQHHCPVSLMCLLARPACARI